MTIWPLGVQLTTSESKPPSNRSQSPTTTPPPTHPPTPHPLPRPSIIRLRPRGAAPRPLAVTDSRLSLSIIDGGGASTCCRRYQMAGQMTSARPHYTRAHKHKGAAAWRRDGVTDGETDGRRDRRTEGRTQSTCGVAPAVPVISDHKQLY